MNTHLNESHVCLMKNWSTFRKMKTSADEVEQYILEIAKIVVADTVHEYASLLELKSDTSKLEKDRWFDLFPRELDNFRQQGIVLFKFGIEGIRLNNIFQPESEGTFRAYVYSPNGGESQHEAIFSAFDALLKSLPDPSGFVPNINDPPGYYYTKKFSPLDADKLCDEKELTKYFREPLVSVIEWYSKYSKQILAIEPKRFKRV